MKIRTTRIPPALKKERNNAQRANKRRYYFELDQGAEADVIQYIDGSGRKIKALMIEIIRDRIRKEKEI